MCGTKEGKKKKKVKKQISRSHSSSSPNILCIQHLITPSSLPSKARKALILVHVDLLVGFCVKRMRAIRIQIWIPSESLGHRSMSSSPPPPLLLSPTPELPLSAVDDSLPVSSASSGDCPMTERRRRRRVASDD